MTSKKDNRCIYCQNPDVVPTLTNWEDKRYCEKCDGGLRKLDKALRAHYIKTGVIRPRILRMN